MALTKQQLVLLSVVVVLLVAVVLDRAGVFVRSASENSPASAYANQAELVQRQRDLAAAESEWEAAHADAQSAWRAASARVIHARSLDLAEEDLHERIETEMRAQGISLAAWRAIDQPVQADQPANKSSIHRVELVFEFASPSTDALYRLVDAIENMHDLWARAIAVDIEGPGIMLLDNASLDVSVRVIAIASIAEQPQTASLAPTNGGLAHAR